MSLVGILTPNLVPGEFLATLTSKARPIEYHGSLSWTPRDDTAALKLRMPF
jgi:hypothetical protein